MLGEAIEIEQARAPFKDVADLTQRCGLRQDQLERLACPAAGELEVVLTVRNGVGFDHR